MCTIVFAIDSMGDTPCTVVTAMDWSAKRGEFVNNRNSYSVLTPNGLPNPYLTDMPKEINDYIDKGCNNNIEGKNNKLSNDIIRLEKYNDELKVDLESALARDELLRSRETVTNSHQLFLLDRPIRRNMIPYLWILSVLFIGVALIIFKMMAPTMASSDSMKMLLFSFFQNVYVLYALLGASAIAILFLSLKVAKVI